MRVHAQNTHPALLTIAPRMQTASSLRSRTRSLMKRIRAAAGGVEDHAAARLLGIRPDAVDQALVRHMHGLQGRNPSRSPRSHRNQMDCGSTALPSRQNHNPERNARNQLRVTAVCQPSGADSAHCACNACEPKQADDRMRDRRTAARSADCTSGVSNVVTAKKMKNARMPRVRRLALPRKASRGGGPRPLMRGGATSRRSLAA